MNEWATWITGLLTPSEWRALIFIVLIVTAITETAKRTFYLRMRKLRKKQYLWGTSFVAGVLSGVAGALTVGTLNVQTHFWIIAGIIAGPVANILHWLTLSVIAWKFPGLAEIIKGQPKGG